MNKIVIIVCCVLFSNLLWGQNVVKEDSSLKSEVYQLKEDQLKSKYHLDSVKIELRKQSQNIEALNKQVRRYKESNNSLSLSLKKEKVKNNQLQSSIDSISQEVIKNRNLITSSSSELKDNISSYKDETTENISSVNSLIVDQKYIGIGVIFLIMLIVVMIYLLLVKRISSSKVDVVSKINNTKNYLEEEAIKLDRKLLGILEVNLTAQKEQNLASNKEKGTDPDHSLALKVADEIVRMQKNMSKIDKSVKGLKPLEKGIERIRSNFASNGYEMVDLLNKSYEERMNIDVINFLEDETLVEGTKMITKIIKPQVNFEGTLIQRAQVEVSQN